MGLLARQRKEELQRVKEQLRQINVALRRQAKIESYAPSLSYVPIGEFKTALELAKSLKDPIEEKKAARGLGTSLKRQGKYQEAIKYHSMVLVISDREGEDSGNTEAYGAIADYYTELGDLEKAGILYDKYIARLETDLRKLHNPPVLPPFNVFLNNYRDYRQLADIPFSPILALLLLVAKCSLLDTEIDFVG
ncbi:protein FLUORESCENT IN BLUE LIGHT, chloroplastic [Gossypium hirsutum]|uniref:Protein FLUORESCENT IN BLUE LIGHT, chloroplastic n=1 Tax=Gossypium hirsutum TaxID=3635 RepID=A0A1U8PAD9_GOSHI|nr:protein FLUORESCENT IN BLUE LIGHT, chloroplastic-like [Gossypium hirsutum]